MLKPELYELIKRSKPAKSYIVDELIGSHGHIVLRLPPYHCNLNPIEMIWGILKTDIAQHNNTFKLADMQQLANKTINNFSNETITKTFDHVLEIEQSYWDSDGLNISPCVPPIIIPLDESESSDSSDED